MTPGKFIPKSELKKHGVYRLHSRNLLSGVWNGEDGFIGIRMKFGSLFLATEYLGEDNHAHATAWPLELIGSVPEELLLSERFGSVDEATGRPVNFDLNGGSGWYFSDTGVSDKNIRSFSKDNDALYKAMDAFDHYGKNEELIERQGRRFGRFGQLLPPECIG